MPRSSFAASAGIEPTTPRGWDARLHLEFERTAERTVLAGCSHVGPLRVQKALYPEGPGVCQAIIVYPPGGIVGGDTLAIDVVAHAGAHAQLTTPGAAKWYRSTGASATSVTTLRIGSRALVEWLPQEAILFDGARSSISLQVELQPTAKFFGWEVTCLGRTASSERFTHGNLRQSVDLFRNGAPIFCERASIDGGGRALQSGAILGSAPVFGTMIAAGATISNELLGACRAVACHRGQDAVGDDLTGEGVVTRLPEVLVARYRGASANAARTYFASLWRLLRPHLAGRDAVIPRIFST